LSTFLVDSFDIPMLREMADKAARSDRIVASNDCTLIAMCCYVLGAEAVLIVGKGYMTIVDGTARMSDCNTIDDDHPDHAGITARFLIYAQAFATVVPQLWLAIKTKSLVPCTHRLQKAVLL